MSIADLALGRWCAIELFGPLAFSIGRSVLD